LADIEAQLDGSRDFVYVLAARTTILLQETARPGKRRLNRLIRSRNASAKTIRRAAAVSHWMAAIARSDLD